MNREEMLQKRIEEFEKENRYLKGLLDEAGISYEKFDFEKCKEPYDENQGARIIHREITPEDANLFFSMFWGRTDVYSKRVVKKATGEVGYFPQCDIFWKSVCHRKSGSKIKCKDCARRSYKKLERKQIVAHLQGKAPNGTDVIGVYTLLADNTCRFIVFDFDNHGKGGEKCDFANRDNEWKEEVDTLRNICKANGIDALAERSRSGKGAHLWIFFQKPIEAALARKFGNALLRKGEENFNLKSFRYYDRMLPMQDCLPVGSLGNLIALPLQGQALKEGNSAFIDENWNAYPNQWDVLFSKHKLSKEIIEDKIKEWGISNFVETEQFENDEKPWDKANHFMPEDVDGKMKIVLADGIYIDTKNLKPRIQNQIRRMAAFLNPVYFKNQVMGLSNFANARYIYLGNDENSFIKIPRALLVELTAQCDKFNVKYEIENNRCKGNEINVEFKGELRKSQAEAVESLVKYDCGILNAATAFGKTVVCSNVIAQKKVNTLIILQSSALMEQWADALNRFLVINEELPEYKTPSGRIKRRKSAIGRLQGAHDSTKGIIDIAMAGSIIKKDECHKRLKEYGLVVLDECHHAASDTIVNVFQEVNAKFVYGVTATPFRGDGLEKINYMLLGPVRYKFTSKDRAKEQSSAHLVYPCFTYKIY